MTTRVNLKDLEPRHERLQRTAEVLATLKGGARWGTPNADISCSGLPRSECGVAIVIKP